MNKMRFMPILVKLSKGNYFIIILIYFFASNSFLSCINITNNRGLKSSPSNTLEVTKLTSSPGEHWFGYYDKQQVSADGRYVLGMKVDFSKRSPTASDTLEIGMVDLQDNKKWIKLGTSKAWGWQQGCMLQWLPGSSNTVLWNDRTGNQYVSVRLDLDTNEKTVYDRAIYTVSPNAKFAMCADFARIDNMRLGYGYKGGKDVFVKEKAPVESGIHKLNLETGESELIISLKEISEIPRNGINIEDKWHYFNHLLVSPDSKRFIFLNRYRDFALTPEMKAEEDAYGKYVRGNYTTRMFTSDVNGENIYELDRSGKTSHFIWRDPDNIMAWTRYEGKNGFYLFEDQARNVAWVGKEVMTENGHQTYIPNTNNEWILNDTYPSKEDRKQTLYLYHVPTQKTVVIGSFYEPEEITGEWRCDLHPRFSLDGRTVIFDSTHENSERQMYMVDISTIIDRPLNQNKFQ